MKKKTEFNKKLLSNIGITQGRLVPSEKQNRIQYFPIKNWKKEMGLMSKNKIRKLEWTINFEKIKQNALFNKNQLDEIINIKNKFDIEIPSVTCDFFMEKPIFKNSNEITLDILKKIIDNGKKIGIKYFILPLVDNSSIKNKKQEKIIIYKLNKFRNYLNYNQKILFEIDYEPKKIKKFISNFGNKFGINYDSGNSASKGFLINDEKIYFDRVYNIHIKDRLYNGKTISLGQGNCDFKSLFLILKNIKYKRNLILQTARSKNNHVKEIIKNIKFIKSFL
jgi:hexulose-6-phosphate isomerase